MQQRSIKTTTFIVVLSIFSIIIQSGAYYFSDYIIPVFIISFLISLLSSYILLVATFSYEACFLYSILTVIFNSIFTILLYFYPGSYLQYSFHLNEITLLYWIVPIFFCIFMNLKDKGPRFVNFNSFFYKMSILFIVYYLGILVFYLFIKPVNLSNSFASDSYFNILPFMSVAEHIENYIQYSNPLNSLIKSFSELLLLFIPMGFYLKLVTKNIDFFKRLFIVVLIPIFIEIIQFATKLGHGDIDDALIGMLGILIGVLLYNTLNITFRYIIGEDFLYNRSPYNFYMRRRF